MRTLQDVIDDLRGNDLPYGDLIVEALQIIENSQPSQHTSKSQREA